ncbi:YveK family protein [Kocuria coralli]|uniref:YveK family protein n=1 Tax=Kocuria coralli TaxID=1461025 RepID=UPI0015F2E0CE|nr:tyrosine protein kinase [Kocuria coralli]
MRESSPYETNEITTREVGHAVWKRWWLPLLGLLLGLGLSLAFSVTQEPKYESVATALVRTAAAEDTAADRLAAEELAKSRAATYESLGNSVVVADTVKHELNLDTPTNTLLDDVRVVASPDTTGLEITATAATPQQATELAVAWRDALADSAGVPLPGENIEVVPAGEPTVPEEPSSFSVPLVYAIGGSVGLLLGIIAAVSLGRPKNNPSRRP